MKFNQKQIYGMFTEVDNNQDHIKVVNEMEAPEPVSFA